MNNYQENFREPPTIQSPFIEDLLATCSGGECQKRDECLYYMNYLKLENKAHKKYGSATCLSFAPTFNASDVPIVERYNRFKQK